MRFWDYPSILKCYFTFFSTQQGPPDILWLEVSAIHNQHTIKNLLNKTLAYRYVLYGVF